MARRGDHGAQHAVEMRGGAALGGRGAQAAFYFPRMMEPGAVEQNQAAPRKWLKQLRQCLLLLKLAQHEVEGRIQSARIDSVQRLADVVVAGQLADAEKRPAGVAVACLPGTFFGDRETTATA